MKRCTDRCAVAVKRTLWNPGVQTENSIYKWNSVLQEYKDQGKHDRTCHLAIGVKPLHWSACWAQFTCHFHFQRQKREWSNYIFSLSNLTRFGISRWLPSKANLIHSTKTHNTINLSSSVSNILVVSIQGWYLRRGFKIHRKKHERKLRVQRV